MTYPSILVKFLKKKSKIFYCEDCMYEVSRRQNRPSYFFSTSCLNRCTWMGDTSEFSNVLYRVGRKGLILLILLAPMASCAHQELQPIPQGLDYEYYYVASV